ncbi:MAG: LysR family transcriptional regulator [Fusobacteriaceae bacterium]|jgi:DNA-binding transcriptional LysR family regulator|nr:LysR family transcriptional regulator [Fusobacteriaceae bacterium]
MTLKALRYFKTLAEIQHFNNAAQQLYVSQPSLSYTITELEKELGVLLFDRKGKKIFLNANGEKFLGYVSEALRIIDDGIEQIKPPGDGAKIINIGCLHSMSLVSVPQLIEKFYADEENRFIKFNFTEGLNEEIKEELYQKKVDMIFCVGKPDNTEAYPVLEQKLYLVASKKNPISARDEISLDEIVNEPFVMIKKDSALRKLVEEEFKIRKAVPNTVFEVNQCNSALTYVSMNFGVSIIPSIPGMFREDLKVLRLINPEVTRTIYVAWLPEEKTCPAVEKVHRFIVGQTAII